MVTSYQMSTPDPPDMAEGLARVSRWARWVLGLVIVGYVAISLSYVIAVPIWEEVDEAGHFAYVKYIRDHGTLPYQPNDVHQLVLSHWFHPPLYYALGALVTSSIDISDFSQVAQPNPHFVWVQGDAPGGWNVFIPIEPSSFPPRGAVLAAYLLRLLSVGMGAGVILIAHQIARLLLPGRLWLGIAAAGATAFNPSFAFVSAGVNNDTVTALLGAAVIWWSATIAAGGLPTWRGSISGGILLGLALLAKTSALALAPVVLFAIALAAVHGKPFPGPSDLKPFARSLKWRQIVATIGNVVGITLFVAGWWYIRNVLVYGDLVAWQRYLVTHAFLVRPGPYNLAAFRDFAEQLAHRYWAAFGYMNLVVDRPIYIVVWIVSIVAARGLGRVVWLIARNRRLGAEILTRPGAWLVATSALVLYLVSLVRYSITLGGVGHGRLIFPILPIASLLLVVGLSQVVPRPFAGAAVGITVAGLAVLAAVCPWAYIKPAYAIPSAISAGTPLPSTASPKNFGPSMRLLDAELDPNRVAVGGETTIRFLWQATVSSGPDLLVTTRLRDREGNIVYQKERRPLNARLPTDRWVAGSVYADRITMDVPTMAYAGSSTVDVSVRPSSGAWLEAVDDRGAALGTEVTIARLAVIGVAGTDNGSKTPMQPTHPKNIHIGDQIDLLGYDLDRESFHPGEILRLALYWRANGPIAPNYTVFAHVADESGRPVAQLDSEPRNRSYPTSVWQTGEVISDPYAIVLPASTPLGRYRLLVGMYDHASGNRLPITGPAVSGATDSVELTSVVVGG